MKEMIKPYRQTPSARPTKIRDLPRIEESSLIAPRAALAALAAQSAYADQQLVGSNYWDPAKALGQNLVDGAADLQKVLDDAVAGITQPVAE